MRVTAKAHPRVRGSGTDWERGAENVLTDGVEESDDPLIDVRNGAYALSFSRRNQ
jgi:hypothetical protein